MKALILSGGQGERLEPIIKDIPKPMAPIAGKPFLEYLILQLVKQGITDIIISIGYKGDIIKSYFEDGRKWCAKIEYSEETDPLDTGGAIKKAIKLITDEQFIVMNGDSFFEISFNNLVSYHSLKKARATLALLSINNTDRYGRIVINNNGEVTKFIEKGCSGAGLINGGVYILNHSIFNNIPNGKVSLENEILTFMANNGLYGLEVKGFFVDIGIPEDYLSLEQNPSKLLNSL